MHEPFYYFVEFLSELELEFPEDVLEAWDCIIRMTAGWHMFWVLI
jgi:hypothetical protein